MKIFLLIILDRNYDKHIEKLLCLLHPKYIKTQSKNIENMHPQLLYFVNIKKIKQIFFEKKGNTLECIDNSESL